MAAKEPAFYAFPIYKLVHSFAFNVVSIPTSKIWDGTIPSKPISQQTFAIASAEAEAVSNIPLSSEWLQDTTELMYKPENNQVVFTVLTIWLIGALVLLIVYWCGSHRLRMIRRYTMPPPQKIQSLFDRCCVKLELKKHIAFRQSRSITAPISFGVKTAFVVLPPAITLYKKANEIFRLFCISPPERILFLSGHGTRFSNDRSSARAHHEPLPVKTMSLRLHARRSTICVG